MLFRVAAAAGWRVADCARLRRLVERAGRPSSDSVRRAEHRPSKAEGAGRLAQWVTAAAELQQTRLSFICRADGAERSFDVHERASSRVRSTECLRQVQSARLQLMGIFSCWCKVNEFDLVCEEQLWTGGRETVYKDAAIAPRIVVGRAMRADSVQVQGSKRYFADASS